MSGFSVAILGLALCMILCGNAECREKTILYSDFYDVVLCSFGRNRKRYNMKTIAFAFEFHVYESVPFEEFDIQQEKIITEKRIIV